MLERARLIFEIVRLLVQGSRKIKEEHFDRDVLCPVNADWNSEAFGNGQLRTQEDKTLSSLLFDSSLAFCCSGGISVVFSFHAIFNFFFFRTSFVVVSFVLLGWYTRFARPSLIHHS